MTTNPSARGFAREPILVTALLVGTALAYLINLSAAGWANSFYAAAVQAGSVSAKAAFFGSSDAANSITVDKPPASLWLMELSARLFGLNSWSLLVPQVLLGVASVALLWATVRRYFGPAAGLLAGLALAVTPVAVLMFRYNNPDALLVFLMLAAVWATLRAVENDAARSTAWMLAAGAFVGAGFLTKQLQVMLIVPPIALTYLLAGPPHLGKRLLQLIGSAVAMVVTAGWWIAVVELWPPASRPWIGGSAQNSIVELTFGYNGLGRLDGDEKGSIAFAPGDAAPHWGDPGLDRMFQPDQAGQIAWLLPAALVLGILGIILLRKVSRTDTRRALLVIFLLWVLVTGGVFSFMAGIFHPYYTVALAPPIAALVAAGAVLAWRERQFWWVRASLAVSIALTAWLAWVQLGHSPDFVPWLRWVVAVVSAAAVVAVTIPALTFGRYARAGVLALLVAGLAGPVAYAVQTIASPDTGAIPSAGPNIFSFNGFAGRFPGGFGEGFERPHRGEFEHEGHRGGGGGLLDSSTPGPNAVAALDNNADRYTWVAAAVGSNQASGYQLATRRPVMPIGGFNGTDPFPSLTQFQQYVADGRIHFFVDGGGGGFMGPGGGAADDDDSMSIPEWVRAHFTKQSIDGVDLYDLTAPRG